MAAATPTFATSTAHHVFKSVVRNAPRSNAGQMNIGELDLGSDQMVWIVSESYGSRHHEWLLLPISQQTEALYKVLKMPFTHNTKSGKPARNGTLLHQDLSNL